MIQLMPLIRIQCY